MEMGAGDYNKQLVMLKEQAWDLAKESLERGREDVYRELVEFVKRLTQLTKSGALSDSSESRNSNGSSVSEAEGKTIPIWERYRGTTYSAKLDTSRMNGRGGECVLFDGQWRTASAAAMMITKSAVNGWIWWKYTRDDGTASRIDDLRRRGQVSARS